jgi:flagellar basal-body rod protein FlgC
MAVTHEGHLDAPASTADFVTSFDDGGALQGSDGNAVTLEREMSKIDANRARYATSAEQVRAVAVSQITQDSAPPRLEYDPGHPQANAQGYVAYPNINPVEEMVDMITASRAYEAGITTMTTAVNMAERALGIGR